MSARRVRLLALGAVALAAALAAVALVASGAGGRPATRAEYRAEVAQARDRVDYALGRITRAKTYDDLTGRLEEAAAVADKAADDLESAGALRGFEDEHEQLVRALRALSAEISGTADTLRDPGFQDVLPLIRTMSFPQWTAVNRALGRLDRRGIRVQPLSRH
ncbi:MAG TPA: hypothetical protein VNJ46_08915 [Gaiellaceae bacterium]|nr:hypothetical protein [Gaiellaceae bacterium]